MSVTRDQLNQLLNHCIGFAQKMLKSSGEFYPFGAALGTDGQLKAIGGYAGNEKPNSQDAYRLVQEGMVADAQAGLIVASALAANVNIPAEYSPAAPDGIRVHVESADMSRYMYIPYTLTKHGLFKKSFNAKFFDPITVDVQPSLFLKKNQK